MSHCSATNEIPNHPASLRRRIDFPIASKLISANVFDLGGAILTLSLAPSRSCAARLRRYRPETDSKDFATIRYASMSTSSPNVISSSCMTVTSRVMLMAFHEQRCHRRIACRCWRVASISRHASVPPRIAICAVYQSRARSVPSGSSPAQINRNAGVLHRNPRRTRSFVNPRISCSCGIVCSPKPSIGDSANVIGCRLLKYFQKRCEDDIRRTRHHMHPPYLLVDEDLPLPTLACHGHFLPACHARPLVTQLPAAFAPRRQFGHFGISRQFPRVLAGKHPRIHRNHQEPGKPPQPPLKDPPSR